MKLKSLFLACLLFPLTATAGGDDEVGVWTDLGIDKSLSKQWNISASTEYRAQDKARWSITAGADYKVCKYFKLGASYTFLYSQRNAKIGNTKTVCDSVVLVDDEPQTYTSEISHKEYPGYWTCRHRICVDAVAGIKLWKWLRISLRERYQYTHRPRMNITGTKYETTYEAPSVSFDEDWNPVIEYDEGESSVASTTKNIAANNDNVLRSRLKLEVDKKHWHISPFISGEIHNNINIGNHMSIEKVRTAVGATYKFRKHNEISLAYLLTFGIHDDDSGDLDRIHERLHAINVGYNYSF